MAELVDALDLGSSAARRGGSSPSIRTKILNKDFEIAMDIEKIIEIKDLKNDKLDLHLSVTLKSDLFEKEIDSEIKKTAKTISMDGFRKGKVPISLIKKRHGDAFRMDVLKDVVTGTLKHISQERKIKTIGEPDISDLVNEQGKDITFLLKYVLLPEIKMPDWDKISLEKPVLDISDKEIDNQLEELIKFSSTFDKKSTVKAKEGDQVILDAVGFCDGKAFEGGKLERYKLVLGSKAFIPGFEDQLVGAKGGDEVTVKVTFPTEYHEKSLAGKEAIFECIVQEVFKPVKPELNDEFAKKFNAENIEDLKKKIGENISNSYRLPIFTHMKRELFDTLEDLLSFDIPEILLAKEKASLIQHTSQDKDNEPEEIKGKSEKEKKEYYDKLAARRVRLGLMLAEYANENKISVSQDDLRDAIFATARQFPGQEAQIFNFYQKNSQAVEQLRGPVLEEKAMKDIFDNKIKAQEKKYSKEKLDKILEDE